MAERPSSRPAAVSSAVRSAPEIGIPRQKLGRYLPDLAARGAGVVDRDPFRHITRQGAAHPETLVVGVGEDDQHPPHGVRNGA